MTIVHRMFVTEETGHENVMARMLREVHRLNCLMFVGTRLGELVLNTELSKQPLYLTVV